MKKNYVDVKNHLIIFTWNEPSALVISNEEIAETFRLNDTFKNFLPLVLL